MVGLQALVNMEWCIFFKFVVRAESVQDYIDLLISMKQQPNIVFSDVANMTANFANSYEYNPLKLGVTCISFSTFKSRVFQYLGDYHQGSKSFPIFLNHHLFLYKT